MGRNCAVIGCTYACHSAPCTLMGPPLLGKGASEATDWAWEQMQSHHNLCIPSSFHLFATHNNTLPAHPPAVQILPWCSGSLHNWLKLQHCFTLHRLSSHLRPSHRLIWPVSRYFLLLLFLASAVCWRCRFDNVKKPQYCYNINQRFRRERSLLCHNPKGGRHFQLSQF